MYVVKKRFAELNTSWVKVIGEEIEDDSGKILEYWRVEKDNSLIVIPLLNNEYFILPKVFYRHGIGRKTYDFPGGRITSDCDIQKEAEAILSREIGLSKDDIKSITQINTIGWPINSSFSNQLLFCVVVNIFQRYKMTIQDEIEFIPVSSAGVEKLKTKLECLQCRAALLEFFFNHQ